VSPRVKRAVGFAVYPLLYLVLLLAFARLTFPYERLKERLTSEFNSAQGPKGMRLRIDSLEGHWVSGVVARGVRLTLAPKTGTSTTPSSEEPRTPATMVVDTARLSVSLLGLLIGSTDLGFELEIGTGTIEGRASSSSSEQSLEVTIDSVPLSQLPMFVDLVGLPLKGMLNGELELVLPERSAQKGEGQLTLTLTGVAAGDGKAKILNTIALPELKVGSVNLRAAVTEGRVKVDALTAKGSDFEMAGDGLIRLRDPLTTSSLDLGVHFKFLDAYKGKSDVTRGLFGTPGSTVPGLFEMNDKVRRSKREDGFYGWRVMGSLQHPLFEPSSSMAVRGAATKSTAAGKTKTTGTPGKTSAK